MTIKGDTTPACAVCKYQRRKCSPNCPLAPYFPANQPKMFQNVHRLFGVSNVTKILESLSTDDQKEDAMNSIIYEAEARHRFPVHGCGVILGQLHLQLCQAVDVLRCVCAQIAACKEQMNNNINHRLGFGFGGFGVQSIESEACLNENYDLAHAFGIREEERSDNYFQDFGGVDEHGD